ncbi:hypothetical protein [Acinetobacter baumannii]|uniref:hypothetical protein n=1 Tax=Acinetobacter baumannii TaxID=470 RepID=UPI00287080D8|nr:hypothetical protein [Acinetobacter baumannii]MDR9624147.1 hypothetical protein [Acinetobacter baumannii]
MPTVLVNSVNIIPFPKSCVLCESKENVQFFAGLMICGNCQENIQITNPDMFATSALIKQKN